MNRYGSITPIEALREIGCFRLAARIHELKAAGHNIHQEMIERTGKRTNKKMRFARYTLTS